LLINVTSEQVAAIISSIPRSVKNDATGGVDPATDLQAVFKDVRRAALAAATYPAREQSVNNYVTNTVMPQVKALRALTETDEFKVELLRLKVLTGAIDLAEVTRGEWFMVEKVLFPNTLKKLAALADLIIPRRGDITQDRINQLQQHTDGLRRAATFYLSDSVAAEYVQSMDQAMCDKCDIVGSAKLAPVAKVKGKVAMRAGLHRWKTNAAAENSTFGDVTRILGSANKLTTKLNTGLNARSAATSVLTAAVMQRHGNAQAAQRYIAVRRAFDTWRSTNPESVQIEYMENGNQGIGASEHSALSRSGMWAEQKRADGNDGHVEELKGTGPTVKKR